VTEGGKPQAPKTLLEALLDSGEVPLARPVRIDTELSAELAARLRAGAPSLAALDAGEWVRLLAAYLDGSLDDAATRRLENQLALSPAGLQDLVAARAYLDATASHRKSAPSELVDAAVAEWLKGSSDTLRPAEVIAFPPASRARGPSPQASSPSPPLVDSFELPAAASGTDHRTILCLSQSGLWTLEVLVGTAAEDEREGRGYLRLTVHPDHRATYDGLTARAFVTIGGEERVLAAATIRDGGIYTDISLRGIDLWRRDAVNVAFTRGQPAP
jgi:hypothetical protein